MAEINPSAMASQMATYYTQSAQDLITTQTKAAQTTSSALSKLQSALQAFSSALSSLSGRKGVVQNAATLSATGIATASATGAAQPGTYSFFVERLASAHQIAFEDLPAVPVATGGPLVVNLADGSSINVDLALADHDGNGTLSQAEIARAVNLSADNQGKVSAMVTTVGGKTQLVLTAAKTGAKSAITVDASDLPDGALKTAFASSLQLAEAQDALVWLGPKTDGLRIEQASNTLTSIPGVTVTLQRAMTVGESLTLTVAPDSAGTTSNVRSFVDAYNTLTKVLGDLTKAGNADAKTASGPFTTDTGVRLLRSRLNELLRQDFGGVRLADLGVAANRSGELTLDSARLERTLAANPGAFDQVFGQVSLTAPSGLLGAIDKQLGQWLNVTTGQIKRRQEAVQATQANLATRQKRLDSQFESAYERYLAQFSRLQGLMAQMSETGSMFQMLGSQGRS